MQATLLAAFEESRRVAFNKRIEPLLSAPNAIGVVPTCVPPSDAAALAGHLRSKWRDGRLVLAKGTVCYGYQAYGKTLSKHDAEQQRLNTLLITNQLLPLARREMPGFAAIERWLARWLKSEYGHEVQLYYAHGLRQGPSTLSSTAFDVHQDTEDFDFIEYTGISFASNFDARPMEPSHVIV